MLFPGGLPNLFLIGAESMETIGAGRTGPSRSRAEGRCSVEEGA